MDVQVLGRAFVRRGMREHAEKLRVYYLALRKGLTEGPQEKLEVKWSAPFVRDWMRTLRLPPYQNDFPLRSRGAGCFRCPRSVNTAASVHLELSLPTGARMRCQSCGAVWLEA